MAKKKKSPTPPPPPVRKKPPRPVVTSTGKPGSSGKRPGKRPGKQAASTGSLKRTLVAAGLATAAVVAVGSYVVLDRRSDAELRDALTSGSCEVDSEADSQTTASGHVPAPTYTVDPPAGGDHNPTSARGGVYAGTRVPADGLLVHAMEHGYVVVWHQSDLPAEQKTMLEDFEQRNDGDVIIAERPSLSVAVAATAWEQRLLCGAVEQAALDRFAEQYIGKGPEDVERG